MQITNGIRHKGNSRFDAITLLKFSLSPYSAMSSTGITRDLLAIILWPIVRYKRALVSSLFSRKGNYHRFRTFYIAK